MIALNAKAWIEKEGRLLIGEGRACILQLIDDTHSLNRTAKEMKMSYRHVWGIIRELEKAAGEPLVASQRGGKGGGKSGGG